MIDFQLQARNSEESLIKSIREIFPYEGRVNKIVADRIWIDRKGSEFDDFSGQKSTKDKERTWAAPIYGKLRLIDLSTGKVIDSIEKMTLVNLPLVTPRGSYIVRGSEYQVSNQFRLKPGVYTRIQENGELESQVNLAKGMNFKIRLNPKSGIFFMELGTTNVGLYHILVAFGIARSKIESVWGKELTEKNASRGSADSEVAKAYKVIFREAQPDHAQSVADLESYFAGNVIDKKTTKLTLGKAFNSVSPDLLLRTSGRILSVSRGQAKADDRDSLEFKQLLSVDDFLKERIEKNASKIKYKMRFNIDRRVKIREIVGLSTFNHPVESFFTGGGQSFGGSTGLSGTPEQTNPLHMVSETTKAILTGAGGITNPHAVTVEARAIHPSSLGFIDPIHTPESDKIGTTLHLPLGIKKRGNDIMTAVYDVKSGKIKDITPQDSAASVISFRDQYVEKNGKLRPKGRSVKASAKGKITMIPASEVDYVFPSAQGIFDVTTNMIPFLQNTQGNRAMTAGKMMAQALPLIYREKPLVRVVAGKDTTFESVVGDGFSHKSPVSGTVIKAVKGEVVIKDKSGKKHAVSIYDNFPLNSKTSFIDAILTVKKGDKVKKGQLIADTNFTRGGELSLGVNANVAYLPFKGYNFEDGVVISEGFSKKFTSSHLYKLSVPLDKITVMNLKKFRAYYPEAIDVSAAAKLDEDGVIEEGETVKFGDLVMAVLKKEEKGPEDVILGKLHRAFIKPYKDRSVTWDEEDEGTVVNVVKTSKKIEVHIKTAEPAKIGDKIAGRYGNKGTLTAIIPDNEMPHDASGNVIEVVLNPHSVPSRINPSQILETVAGKVAMKQGRPFDVRNFTGRNYLEDVETAAKKVGVQDKEDLTDPVTNQKIPGVLVGRQYMLKLDHPTRKKFSARAQGGYTADMQPSRGKHEGGQSMDALTLYSMLSHGAKANLREMATYKSSRNDEVWRALQLGQGLPAPAVPFAFDKFISMIKGLGVDVKKDGNTLILAPMTSKQVKEFSSGAIKNSKVVRGKDLRPEKGGLFDPMITGGIAGDKWNHIELAEEMPNPIFENAIKAILGITQSVYDDIISGRRYVSKEGKITVDETDDSETSGPGIKLLLSKIDVDKKIESLNAQAKGKKGSDLDKINKTIRYLQALKTHKLKPTDYVVKNVPVIPARLRPVYPLPDGSLNVTEVNHLYKDLIDLTDQTKDFIEIDMPDDEMRPLRENVYKGMKAIAGLHDHLGGRGYKGLIEQIKGNTNKEGFFQNRVMSRRQEFSGRSTVVPEPALGLDEVAIPEEMAWKIYRPFIVRELVKQGYKDNALEARGEMENRTPLAKRALQIAMEDRPVMINRAPSLHKFSIMSFLPSLTTGKAIKVNPLIVKGFNMDFDGDTAAVHVPITEEARVESFKMLPSRNLFNPRSGELMNYPTQEAITGLYLFTQSSNGRNALNKIMPDPKFHIKKPLTGKRMTDLLTRISKEHPNQFTKIVNAMKDIGNRFSYESGFSIGLEDLKMNYKARDQIFSEAESKIKKTKGDKLQAIIDAYSEAAKKLDANLIADKRLKANSLMIMSRSGAKGNIVQIRQILASPVLVKDVNDNIVPVPIKNSYAEGLDLADYWSSMSGARKGMIDRSLQTSIPGAFSKELLNVTVNHVVTEVDCGTKKGIDVSITDSDIVDRFLARGEKGVGRRNSIVTHFVVKKARLRGLKTLLVRSPLTCEADKGVCQKCYGLSVNGMVPSIGHNVGVEAGQAIAEPATQMTMRTFHTGGAAGVAGGVVSGFTRVSNLLKMPRILKGKATISRVKGTVDSIGESPIGGWTVMVGGEEHYVPAARNLLVKKGNKIGKGDRLSDGPIKPQEILELRGMRATQDYLVDSLKNEYSGQGIQVKRRILETVVRPLTNTARVLHPGGHPTYVPGDFAPLTKLQAYNQDKNENGQVTYEEIIRGINTAPLMSQDWLTRLNFQRLKDTLIEGPSQGWKTDISSVSAPLAAYAYGPEIGREKNAEEVGEEELEETESV